MDKNEMSDTLLVKKYIDSVDGIAHQSAVEIIINLEKKLAEKKTWVNVTKEELQTIFNYEPNDVKHIAFLVESLCKEKNGG